MNVNLLQYLVPALVGLCMVLAAVLIRVSLREHDRERLEAALSDFARIDPLPYGTPGTRDVDVARWHTAHAEARKALGYVAEGVAA